MEGKRVKFPLIKVTQEIKLGTTVIPAGTLGEVHTGRVYFMDPKTKKVLTTKGGEYVIHDDKVLKNPDFKYEEIK